MSDVFTIRGEPSRGKVARGDSTPQEPPRIHLDVPMGTSYREIQEIIFRQAWQLAGTQLRAAIALAITPDTLSRFLRRCDRARIGGPQTLEARPTVADNRVMARSGVRFRDSDGVQETPEASDPVDNGKDRLPDSAMSVGQVNRRSPDQDRTSHRITESSDRMLPRGRVNNAEHQLYEALTPFSEDEESYP